MIRAIANDMNSESSRNIVNVQSILYIPAVHAAGTRMRESRLPRLINGMVPKD
jgi:hypothetical protein